MNKIKGGSFVALKAELGTVRLGGRFVALKAELGTVRLINFYLCKARANDSITH